MLDPGPGDRREFERVLGTLVGRAIRSVAYYEIAYPAGAPMWGCESDSFDSLDFGLTFDLDDDSIFSFTWGSEFTQYNVSVSTARLAFGDTAREWDADQRWASLLDLPIVAVATLWLPGFTGDPEYPQSVRLAFASGNTVTISAFDGEMGMMDNITVFFDEAEACRMGCGFGERG